MRALGIVPARGGSKRLPAKNIRLLNGRPTVNYTIEAALGSRQLDRVIISTDSRDIAEICRAAGAEVPFLRPEELAQDDTPDKPVLVHAVRWLETHESYVPDVVVLLRPTTPFKTSEIIDEAVSLIAKTDSDSVRSVTRVEGVQHPYWMFTKDSVDRARPLIEGVTLEEYYQRQMLPPVYRLNSVVDVIKTNVVRHHEKLYGDDMRLLEVAEDLSLDIDTEHDFRLCEILMRESTGQ